MHSLLNLEGVMRESGFSRPQIYKLVSEGKFPRQITMGRRSFWLKDEVEQWFQTRINERNTKMAAE